MSEIGGDVSTVVTRLGADLSREAAKMTNESMKQMLLFLIQKAKEQGDKAGEVALSKLVKSNDEIKLFDLDQKQLKAFNELAKKYEISYAVVKDQNQLSVFYKQSEESRVKLVLEKLVERELKDREIPVTKMDEKEQQQSGLSLIREKLFRVKNDQMESVRDDKAETVESKHEEVKQLTANQNNVTPYEVVDPKGNIEMTFVIDRNGMFERLEKHQLDERVKRILENMKDNEKHHFDVGNKRDRISVERQGHVYVFRAEHDHSREEDQRTTLAEKLGTKATNVRTESRDQGQERMSLAERREEIKPLMEAQKQAPPTKNKNKERGGR